MPSRLLQCDGQVLFYAFLFRLFNLCVFFAYLVFLARVLSLLPLGHCLSCGFFTRVAKICTPVRLKSISYRRGLFSCHIMENKSPVRCAKKSPGFDTKFRAFLEAYGTFKNSRTCCRSTTSYDIFYFNVYQCLSVHYH